MVSTAVDPQAVARTVGIKTEFVNRRGGVAFLPQQILVIGQGADEVTYSTERVQVLSQAEAGKKFGFGSPIHLAVRELLPSIGDGVGIIPVYVAPLEADESGVAATGSIDPDAGSLPVDEAASYRVVIAGIPSERFVIDPEDDAESVVEKMAEAINAVVDMPVIATADTTAAEESVGLEAKWSGESSNNISLAIETDGDAEFTITDMAGGLINPDIQPALDTVGESTWITLMVNTLNPDDEDALDALSQFGEARWDPLVRKPFFAFRGTTEADVQAATAITNERTADRTNVLVPNPGGPEHPAAIAAAFVGSVATLANRNPPHDYGSRPLPRLAAGDVEWNYTERDTAIRRGGSTVEIKDGQVNISDVVTSYSPEGEVPPAYRFVVDGMKLMQVLFNLDLIFSRPQWDGAPLIPDDQATVNPDAKKPKDAKAVIAKMLDSLGAEAIISDPDTAKENTQAEIDSQNPKRLNVRVPVQVSGNTNIRSITMEWGFFFGGN